MVKTYDFKGDKPSTTLLVNKIGKDVGLSSLIGPGWKEANQTVFSAQLSSWAMDTYLG